MRLAIKINRAYQFIALLLGLLLIASAIVKGSWWMILLGVVIMVSALATIMHINTGKSNIASNLPPDHKVKD